MSGTVDITPSPRVLRVLGDIPFALWQSVAELIDNSIDAYSKDENRPIPAPILINWSNESVARVNWTLDVIDHAQGMTLEEMRDAVRAGYSSNDAFNNLGLFGMGFNIATARLGEITEINSGRLGEDYEHKLTIDFEELQRKGKFEAPFEKTPKAPDKHGTRITIRKIKPDCLSNIQKGGRDLIKTLGDIYSPILEDGSFEIRVNGRKVSPRKPCVWDEARFLIKNGERVHAIQKIDIKIPDGFYDTKLNRYLSGDEMDFLRSDKSLTPEQFDARVQPRERSIKGWLGIQRYGDRTHFGIDFVRNGRKILIRDKAVFEKQSAITGEAIIEYPIELPGTFGGRIVGMVHVDFLKPTYQKNDFDRSDNAWSDVVSAIRGNGDIMWGRTKGEQNLSALAKLASTYRRCDQGTKCLVAPNSLAKDYLQFFERNEPDYISDKKWYEAALAADRDKTGAIGSGPDKGPAGLDSVDDYLPDPGVEVVPSASSSDPKPVAVTEEEAKLDLLARSKKEEAISGSYKYGGTAPYNVEIYRLISGSIIHNAKRKACRVFHAGVNQTFFYDPSHQLFREYLLPPELIASVILSDLFNSRDRATDFLGIFCALVEEKLSAHKFSLDELREKANSIFQEIRSFAADKLPDRYQTVYEVIDETAGAMSALMEQHSDSPEAIDNIKKRGPLGVDSLRKASPELLIQMIDKMPEEFLDNKLFNWAYTSLDLGVTQQTETLRRSSIQRFIGMLRSVKWIQSEASLESALTSELKHSAASIDIVTAKIVK